MVAVLASDRSSTGSTGTTKSGVVRTTQSVSNGARLASEGIGALLTTCERASLLLELGHGDSGKRGGGVVLGFVVVDFMDGDGGVDDGGLDGLLLDDWLDVLVYVVVDVFASNRW